MKYFKDIASAFKITNAYIPYWFLTLDERNEPGRLQELKRLITVNTNAYFLLVFSQFEAEINGLCRQLIREKQQAEDWLDRRAWDILNPAEDRLRNIAFLNRLALLTDKGGTVYKHVKQLYDTRNKIAHGELQTEPLDVAEIANEIQRIAVSLKGVP